MTNQDQPGALVWRKSRRSGNGNNCVEVADNLTGATGTVLVRDSKAPAEGNLMVDAEGWTAFTRAVQAGSFDL